MSKVYILGAGASAEYRIYDSKYRDIGVPTDKTFWSAAERVIELSKKDTGPKLPNSKYLNYPRLKNQLKAIYGFSNLRELDKEGLEEVFSYLYKEDREQFYEFQRLLEWVLFEFIRGITKSMAPIHYQFAMRKLQPGDTIITFNYDLIIDQVIWDCADNNVNSIRWHPSTGYHIDFVGYRNRIVPGNPISDLEKVDSNIFVCKLHGSLGWFFESERNISLYLSVRNGQMKLASKGFLERRLLIVPPIKRKKIDENFPHLSKIWLNAVLSKII